MAFSLRARRLSARANLLLGGDRLHHHHREPVRDHIMDLARDPGPLTGDRRFRGFDRPSRPAAEGCASQPGYAGEDAREQEVADAPTRWPGE